MSFGTEAVMTGFSAKGCVLSACLLPLLAVIPAHADPFFVKVYGRTYKVDPRPPAEEPKSLKPEETMKALPSDIARGPDFRPSHEEVLAEVEERTWITQNQLAQEIKEKAISRNEWASGVDAKVIDQEITGSVATREVRIRAPEVQTLYDRHQALNLLARELRRSMDLPVRSPEAGFSRPKLSPKVEAGFRDLTFDPLEAYYGFRRVKAAFRSGDVELLSRVAHYPLTLTGKTRRTIRNREQLVAAKDKVLNARIREVVAKATFATVFVRDKGMMLGEGEVWITPGRTGFGLGSITVP
jgi:hypothetical protein